MKPLRTVIIGFGKVSATYADDPAMARYYPYSTHAQVLASHPAFAWEAVVDPDPTALQLAKEKWQIHHVAIDVTTLAKLYEPEVAVIATPPQYRLEIIEQLPTLKAVLVEKPLGTTISEAELFLEKCHQRGLLVQANLWRRADTAFRSLAQGQMKELIGTPQTVLGVYGNGLLNNGVHVVDFMRMLFGEIEQVQAIGAITPYIAGPIAGDVNVPFTMRMEGDIVATFHPLRFEHYREVGLDVWGTTGRLAMMHEGLDMVVFPRQPNRAMQDEFEVSFDQPTRLDSTVGMAFYQVYENLAQAIHCQHPLWIEGQLALEAAKVISAINSSSQQGGKIVSC
jgi:predicted dehydrogenase